MTKQITQEEYDTLVKTIKASYKANRASWDMCDVATNIALPFTPEDFESTQDWMTDICLNRSSWGEAEDLLNEKLGIKVSPDVSVLLLNEGDYWSAQCLEYDISAQGKSKDDVILCFTLKWILTRGYGDLPKCKDSKVSQAHHYAFNHLLNHPSEDGEAWFYTP